MPQFGKHNLPPNVMYVLNNVCRVVHSPVLHVLSLDNLDRADTVYYCKKQSWFNQIIYYNVVVYDHDYFFVDGCCGHALSTASDFHLERHTADSWTHHSNVSCSRVRSNEMVK